jgi:MFS family permease
MRLLAGMRSLPTMYYGMLSILVPLLINQTTGSKVSVAIYGTTNLIVASIAQLIAGRAADRWGARGPTLAGYSILILSGLGLSIGAGSFPMLFGFGVLGIAAAWSLSTMMFVWVNDGVEKSRHPAVFGLLHSVWSLSMMSGSLYAGWAVSNWVWLPFITGSLLNMGSLMLTRTFYRKNIKGFAPSQNPAEHQHPT